MMGGWGGRGRGGGIPCPPSFFDQLCGLVGQTLPKIVVCFVWAMTDVQGLFIVFSKVFTDFLRFAMNVFDFFDMPITPQNPHARFPEKRP